MTLEILRENCNKYLKNTGNVHTISNQINDVENNIAIDIKKKMKKLGVLE